MISFSSIFKSAFNVNLVDRVNKMIRKIFWNLKLVAACSRIDELKMHKVNDRNFSTYYMLFELVFCAAVLRKKSCSI